MQRFLVSVLGVCLLGGPAWAGLEVCNETSDKHTVSIGYKADGDWVSEGWWAVEAGACTTVISRDLDLRYYYYFARAKGHKYEGKYAFCVETPAYTIVGDTDCAERGYSRELFFEADIGEATSWSVTLEGAPVAAKSAPKAAAKAPAPSAAPAPAPAPEPVPQSPLPVGGGYYPYADFDSGMESGRFGEPYSVEARFTGCNQAEGDFVCFFMTDGWEWVVYQDEATPSFAMDELSVVTLGQRIWVQGDVRSYGEFVVDATVRAFQAIEERSDMDALWETIQGQFVNGADSASELSIFDNTYTNLYGGEVKSGGSFYLVETCPDGPPAGPAMVQFDPETSERLCYVFQSADQDGFVMTYSGYYEDQVWRRR